MQEMSGDPNRCPSGTSQGAIACVLQACQENMTESCLNRMMMDFATYQPWLVSYCSLAIDDPQLSIATGVTCRDVCRRDRTSCRERRATFCSQQDVKESQDNRIQRLCACYQRRDTYQEIVERAIQAGSISGINATQLGTIRDILTNALNYPFCWSAACSGSDFGADTEISNPCQSISLCVQTNDVGEIRAGGSITLTNNCTLNSSRVTDPVSVGVDGDTITPTETLPIAWTSVYLLLGAVIFLVVLLIFIVWIRTPRKPSPVYIPIPVRSKSRG